MIKKFGTTLTSRQFGKEALMAFKPTLGVVKKNEIVEVDFSDVNTFSPSWGDEFLSPLVKEFGDRLAMKHTANASVKETLDLLEEVNGYKFVRKG